MDAPFGLDLVKNADKLLIAGIVVLNCLKAADVETLGELVQFNKNDLLKFRNFGKKSLTELDELLENLNLTFGMDITKYKLDKE